MIKMRFVLAFTAFLIFAACSVPDSSGQVPPALQEYKDSDWTTESEDIEPWWNAEGDSVTAIYGGKLIYGEINGQRVAYCEEIVGDFFPLQALVTEAWAAMEDGDRYGMNDPLGLLTSCVQWVAGARDTLSTND